MEMVTINVLLIQATESQCCGTHCSSPGDVETTDTHG